MPYTFRIVFRGLCAFVPRFESGVPKELSVLMPFSQVPRLVTKGRNHIVPRHAAVLMTDPSNLVDSTGEEVRVRLGGAEWSVYDLSKFRVSVETTESHPLELRMDDSEHSISHLLNVRDLLGGGRKIACPKSKYFKNISATSEILINRFELTKGTLYCQDLDRDLSKELIEWHWHPLGAVDAERTGPLAIRMGLELKLEDAPVALHLSRFGDDSPTKVIPFKAGSDVEVFVAHSEIEKLINLEPAPVAVENGIFFDHDVRAYITMTRGVNLFTKWQHVWSRIDPQAGGLHGICKSVMLDHPNST